MNRNPTVQQSNILHSIAIMHDGNAVVMRFSYNNVTKESIMEKIYALNSLEMLNDLEKDPELKAEFIKTLNSEDFQPPSSSLLNNPGLRKLTTSTLKKPFAEVLIEERVISALLMASSLDKFMYPVVRIKNDVIDPMVRNNTIENLTHQEKLNIQKAIRASGRIERSDNDYLGTAWLITEDIVTTNRHVVETFLQEDVAAVRVNFKGEYNNPAASLFGVKNILYISPDPDVDLAFLQVEKKKPTRRKSAGTDPP
jgi:hypothetical protein